MDKRALVIDSCILKELKRHLGVSYKYECGVSLDRLKEIVTRCEVLDIWHRRVLDESDLDGLLPWYGFIADKPSREFSHLYTVMVDTGLREYTMYTVANLVVVWDKKTYDYTVIDKHPSLNGINVGDQVNIAMCDIDNKEGKKAYKVSLYSTGNVLLDNIDDLGENLGIKAIWTGRFETVLNNCNNVKKVKLHIKGKEGKRLPNGNLIKDCENLETLKIMRFDTGDARDRGELSGLGDVGDDFRVFSRCKNLKHIVLRDCAEKMIGILGKQDLSGIKSIDLLDMYSTLNLSNLTNCKITRIEYGSTHYNYNIQLGV